jgi:MFS family permease
MLVSAAAASANAAKQRIVDGITMFIVTGLSLLLLVYVGVGEGKRTYERLDIEKLTSAGSRLQADIENNLRAGLPLKQFAGFTTLAERLLNGAFSIEEINAIVVYDTAGQSLFSVIDEANPKLPSPSPMVKTVKDSLQVDKTDTHTHVILPLRNRFETVGSLAIVASRGELTNRVNSSFRPILLVIAVLSALFAIVVWFVAPYLARTHTPWLQIGYALTFLVTAGGVVATLVSLYSEGVQGKLHASALTLSQRLVDVVEFNINFEHIEGVERVFQEYRKLNPDISEASLVIDGKIKISTDVKKIGKPWVSDARNFEYDIDLSGPAKTSHTNLVISAPTVVVYDQVERSVRNFAALFIASAFLAGLFLQVASSMQRLRSSSTQSRSSGAAKISEEAGLIIVKPVFFLAVFLEHLLYSFLPKFMQDVAVESGVSLAYAAAPFTAYYLCFALILIPAGHFAERHGPRALIWGGLILASASVFGLALPLDIIQITVLRGVAGIGQGMLFIGIQTYILAVASPEKKTQGAAIIVFGFQGGMISGMAIGSLLVNYLEPHGVFLVSGVIGAAAAVYCGLLIPRVVHRSELSGERRVSYFGIATGLKSVLSNAEFLKTILCIGIPAKAILTGTITFALPLLLGQHGYRLEDVGQIIMLYAMSVVAASSLISRLVDRTGNTTGILFWGAAISGAGLVLIGSMDSPLVGNGLLGSGIVVLGVILVGLAHGFINAPVVTHVAHSQLAKEVGANSLTTTYRFVERIGHIAGPALVVQLFLIWGQSPKILIGLGIATTVLAFLFLIRSSTPRVRALGPEIA